MTTTYDFEHDGKTYAAFTPVVVTMPSFIAAEDTDATRAEAVKVNDWLIAQQTAGREGLRVVDTRAIEGLGNSDLVQLLDGVHRGPIGAVRVAKTVALPVLQAMVSAGNWRGALDPLSASNVFPAKGLPGTTGTRTVASGNAGDLTGTVATGIGIHRQTGTSTAVMSKEVIAAGNEKQVVTITPVADATALHEFRLRSTSSTDITLASLGVAPATHCGIEVIVPVELNDWAGWEFNINTGAGPAGLNVTTPAGAGFTQATTSGSARNGLNMLSCFFEIFEGNVPTAIRMGTFGYLANLTFRSDAGGTGVAKFGSPIFLPVLKANHPKLAWGL